MRRCDRRGRRRRTAAITTAAQAANNRRRTKVDHVRCILEDRLSGLPDDILAHILSFLETTEAAGTSALSRRWRNTWTLTDTLNFDQSDYSGMVFTSTKEFILLVDKALYSHQSRIKGFKVGFWLNGEICKHAIDRWLTHALQKRVQKVELDFKSNFYSCFSSYILTSSLLCDLKSDSLKILQLKFVPVSGEVLTHILSNCPFLEVLRVHDSNSLIELNVPGSAWNLKCLEIVSCSSMTCLKILSTNLLSFAYSGQKIHMLFMEVPRIVHLSIGGGHAEFLVKNVNQFSGLTSLLESLMLDLSCSRLDDDQSFNSLNCPKFLKLKQLKLMLPKPDIDVCINVLQASPLLRRFTLQIPVVKIKRDDKTETLSKVLNEANFTHNHLEEIELVGFTGREVEISLLLTLVQCCVACKKVIVYSFP